MQEQDKKVDKTNEEWKKELSAEEYRILGKKERRVHIRMSLINTTKKALITVQHAELPYSLLNLNMILVLDGPLSMSL